MKINVRRFLWETLLYFLVISIVAGIGKLSA